MAAKKIDRSLAKRITPELRENMVRHLRNLDRIIDEYAELVVPGYQKHTDIPSGANVDVFEWAKNEHASKHNRRVQATRKELRELCTDMARILELPGPDVVADDAPEFHMEPPPKRP